MYCDECKDQAHAEKEELIRQRDEAYSKLDTLKTASEMSISDLRKQLNKGARQIDGLLFAAKESAEKQRESDLQNDALKEILRRVEWAPDSGCTPGTLWCPVCENKKESGHTEDCELGHALHGVYPPMSEKRVGPSRKSCPGCDGTPHPGECETR